MGVNTELLTPMSYGESKPLVTEESDWARAVNRRVQFTLGEVVNPEVVKTSLPEAKIQ
jgi:outer membrane protein OmpA-like peptidoglycan-associated protein